MNFPLSAWGPIVVALSNGFPSFCLVAVLTIPFTNFSCTASVTMQQASGGHQRTVESSLSGIARGHSSVALGPCLS